MGLLSMFLRRGRRTLRGAKTTKNQKNRIQYYSKYIGKNYRGKDYRGGGYKYTDILNNASKKF